VYINTQFNRSSQPTPDQATSTPPVPKYNQYTA
jgi:hypothetical protein